MKKKIILLSLFAFIFSCSSKIHVKSRGKIHNFRKNIGFADILQSMKYGKKSVFTPAKPGSTGLPEDGLVGVNTLFSPSSRRNKIEKFSFWR